MGSRMLAPTSNNNLTSTSGFNAANQNTMVRIVCFLLKMTQINIVSRNQLQILQIAVIIWILAWAGLGRGKTLLVIEIFFALYSKQNHTIYSRNNMRQKCGGNCGLWILHEIIQNEYSENLRKMVGALWELPAK